MKNYCQLAHLQFSSDPSDSYETGMACNDNDRPCMLPFGFSSDHILIQVSTPKSPFYTTPRTRKTPSRHCCSCSSPVSDHYDNHFPGSPGYISLQMQYSPKLALPFIVAPNITFKSFKVQDGENCQFCGYGYPYAVVTPHKTVITPRTSIRDDNDEEEGEKQDDDEEGIDGLLWKHILNVCQSFPEDIKVQLLNLKGLDELISVERGLKISSTVSRGLGGPMEDLSLKLERFKIRTVDIDDFVTKEEKK